uniref:Uncharacterized protein n=1 Tax=Anguilla anguilla TaxID=7936 RepID=A0A0E9XHS7_ANGAN
MGMLVSYYAERRYQVIIKPSYKVSSDNLTYALFWYGLPKKSNIVPVGVLNIFFGYRILSMRTAKMGFPKPPLRGKMGWQCAPDHARTILRFFPIRILCLT